VRVNISLKVVKMVNSTFPVSGKLYNLNGTSVIAGTKVKVFNYTKGETYTSPDPTNVAGEFAIDLANMPTQWESSDVLYLYAKGAGKHAVARAIIGSGDNSWEQDIYMKVNELNIDDSDNSCPQTYRISGINAFSGSAKNFLFIEKSTDTQKWAINVGANGTIPSYIGKPGILMQDGFWILTAAQGTNISNQGSGVSNAIGDISSMATVIITCNIY
jgi:hypothetical protein